MFFGIDYYVTGDNTSIMAKNVGEKPKRITHLGNSSNSNFKTKLKVDYIQDIINDMDSMKQFNHHAQYENALKFLRNKPEVVPNASEKPPDCNIHGTKLIKAVASSKYHPLMAKCQKNLKYILHNRSIPKPRAHIKKISKSPIKKAFPKFASYLTNNKSYLGANEKIKHKTSEAFKRSFPKPESDVIKLCQPAKKMHKKNSIQNASEDSKQPLLVSKKVTVVKKKEKSCSISDESLNHSSESNNVGQLSEKDTDDDFETFVKKLKGKHSLHSNKSCKKTAISTDMSSDEEVESAKKKLKGKKKKALKSKCPPSSKITKQISLHESQKKRSDSLSVIETNKSCSAKQVSDNLGKEKRKKKETCENKFLQNESGTVNFNYPKKIKRSKYLTESSESESTEMYPENNCDTSSDECTETADKPLPKIHAENDTNTKLKELTNKTIIHDISERIKPNVFNDTSVDLKNEKNVIFSGSKNNKKLVLKTCMYSSVNVLDSISCCSVVIKRDHNIDMQAKTSILNFTDSKNAVINDSCTLPVANNEILIEISDEEGCDQPKENGSMSDSKCFSDLPLNIPSNFNTDLNPDNKVQVENTRCEIMAGTNSMVSYPEKKVTSDNEDSDVEIIEVKAPACSVSKYHNSTNAANGACISQKTNLDQHNLFRNNKDQDTLNASLEQLNSCEPKVSFGASKNDAIKENLKVEDSGVKLRDGVNTNLAVGSTEDDVTVIETFFAGDKTKNVSNTKGHVITSPAQKAQTTTINTDFILSSYKNKCEELSATDDEEFLKSSCKSIGEFTNKEVNTCDESDVHKTECNSGKCPTPSNEPESSLSKNLNVLISDEDDCIVLEPISCLTKELKKSSDVPLENKSFCVKNSSSDIEVKIEATQNNSIAKLSSSGYSLENTENGFVKSEAIHASPVCSNQIADSSLTKLSKTSESQEFKDLESDCIILDDASIEASTAEIRHDSLHKDKSDQELIKNYDLKSIEINCIAAGKITTANRPCELNQVESSLQKQTLSDFSTLFSAKNFLSNINKDMISDASFNNRRQTFHCEKEESSLVHKETKCLFKTIECISASNVGLSFVKSEKSSSHLKNRFFVSDACDKANSPSINVEQKIHCKVEKMESLPLESSTERNLITKVSLVNDVVKNSNSDVVPQKKLEVSKNVSSDIDKKLSIDPNPASATGVDIDVNKSNNLNLENSRESKKNFLRNIPPHPSVFNRGTSYIPHSNKDLSCSGSLNTVDLDSLKSLKTQEVGNFLNSSLNELDAFTESSIYELSCTENKSLLPLLNLYKNEVMYYQKLKQTVKNVDAGIKTALDMQTDRLKHLSFSIINLVRNDPCFRNSISASHFPPAEHKPIVEHGLPDNILGCSAKDLKKNLSSKNNINDSSSSATIYSNLGNVNPKSDQTLVSSSYHKSPINFDNIPQLSLESLHEKNAHCVENIPQISVKSESAFEISKNEYFEEERKYSKCSSFSENQPEALQDLKNSKCCVCNKPAIGACYFCCRVFYCSVECSEGPVGKHHNAECSKKYIKNEKD